MNTGKGRKAALIRGLSIDNTTSAISATERSCVVWLSWQNSLSTSSGVGQCSRWHCSESSASSRSSVMVERIDVSVRYNLAKMHSDSDVVTGSVPMISTQQSVDVCKFVAAATAECCRSIVRALFCCRRRC